MDAGRMGRPRLRASRRLIVLAALAALAVASLGLTGTASATTGNTTWLCKPGLSPDPCTESRTATVVTYTGNERHETIQKPGGNQRAVDCFYVYPTVSEQTTVNANLEIEPQEKQIAIDQASRFSQYCRVFAPMYPQLTLKAIQTPGAVQPINQLIAFNGVDEAWKEYLKKYNRGRPVVLIGHSQGAAMLEALIQREIDPEPAVRSKLLSAILLGGNVLVPEGQLEGGTFQNIPLCTAVTDTGCVIAYSTFLKEPPENSFFGRPSSPLLGGPPPPPGMEVACVNPTLLKQSTGTTGNLIPYASTTPFPGVIGPAAPTPSASTPWVSTRGTGTATCMHQNGATWLQIETSPSVTPEAEKELLAHNEVPLELLGPEWGLHLYDVNIALGNLVNTVAIQTIAYGFTH